MDTSDTRFQAGEPPRPRGVYAGLPPATVPPAEPVKRGLAVRILIAVGRRLLAAIPVGLFALIQYWWYLTDRHLAGWSHKPYVALGPLYFLANESTADDWIGYALLAVAAPCLLAVVVWPRRWSALLACATVLAWVVPGCIDAAGRG